MSLLSKKVEDLILAEYISTSDVIDEYGHTLDVILRNNGTVNVKSFGAIGNGNVDDTIAIQHAIDHAANLNVTLYFPAGKYKVTPLPESHGLSEAHCALFIDKPITIIGNSASIQLNSCYSRNVIFLIKTSNVKIDRLEFEDLHPCIKNPDSDNYIYLISHAIAMGNSVDMYNDITDPTGTDWLSDDSICYQNISITNCTFKSFFYAVFIRFTPEYLWDNVNKCEKITHSLIENISIVNCQFIGRLWLNEYGERTKENRDLDNNASININGGIPSKFQFVNNLRIQGCYISHASNAAGIGIIAVSNFSILGCVCEECDQVGIQVENSPVYSNGVIQNIILKECDYGILIDDSSNIAINGITYRKHKLTQEYHNSYAGGIHGQSIAIAITAQGSTIPKKPNGDYDIETWEATGADIWGNGKICDNITVSDVNSCNGGFMIGMFGKISDHMAGNGIGRVCVSDVQLEVVPIDGQIGGGGTAYYAFYLSDSWPYGNHGTDTESKATYLFNNVCSTGFKHGIYAAIAHNIIFNNFNIQCGNGPFNNDNDNHDQNLVVQTNRNHNLILSNGSFEYTNNTERNVSFQINKLTSTCQSILINDAVINDFVKTYDYIYSSINNYITTLRNDNVNEVSATSFIVYPDSLNTTLSIEIQSNKNDEDENVDVHVYWDYVNASDQYDTYSSTDSLQISHSYDNALNTPYIVSITGSRSLRIVSKLIVYGIINWANDIVNVDDCFSGCRNLISTIPNWPDSVLFAWRCYSSTNIHGNIPSWNNIRHIGGCYSGCQLLTGPIPEFPNAIVNGYAGTVYNNCSKLTGNIPRLNNSNITTLNGTFTNCSMLSGNIPQLPNDISSMIETFKGCTGLTGFWDDSQINERCPSSVDEYHRIDCYQDCSDAVKDLVYQSWGGNIEDPPVKTNNRKLNNRQLNTDFIRFY